MWERNIYWLLRPGTEPTTQECALTRDQTGNLLLCGAMPKQLSHTSLGSAPGGWHLSHVSFSESHGIKKPAQLHLACHQIATKVRICILRSSRKWHHNYPKYHITFVESIPVKKHWKWLSVVASWNWCWWGWCAVSGNSQNFRNPQPRPEAIRKSWVKYLDKGGKTPFWQNVRDSAKTPQPHFLCVCLCRDSRNTFKKTY